MNYTDLKQSSEWIAMMNEFYINEVGGAPVFVYKLDKVSTKIDPLYGEEINGRNYLRPFKLNALHLVNPFEFMFKDNLIGEFENETKQFNFNLNQVVQKMKALKEEALSTLHIIDNKNDGVSWAIEKRNGKIVLYKNNIVEEVIEVEEVPTIELLGSRLANPGFSVQISGENDFTRNLRDFNKIDFADTELLLKTYNKEYKNCSDVIENGDLIYLEDTNVLYEVTSAQPAGNFGWQYQMWNVKCGRSFPYVNYNKLKSQIYGFKDIDFGYQR